MKIARNPAIGSYLFSGRQLYLVVSRIRWNKSISYTVDVDVPLRWDIRRGAILISALCYYRAYVNTSSIGITSGISSVIYSLLKISAFLDDPSFIVDAERVSTMVTPSMIQNDQSFDIMSGSAGCILRMLTLYNHSGHSEHLEKAILCGDHLLKNVTNNKDGSCGWTSMEKEMLVGFSHGQAGIAYALL